MKFLLWTALASAVYTQALEWKAHYRMTGAEYQQTFDHYVSLGYALNSVSGYERDGVANYAAIFEKTNRGAWSARHGLTSSSYATADAEFTEKGYHLSQVNGYTVNGVPRFAAIWEPVVSNRRIAHIDLTGDAMQEVFDQYKEQGYKPIHVSGYEVNGARRYAAIYELITEDNLAWWSWAHMTSSRYQERFDGYLEDGYRLTDVSGYSVDGNVYFNAVWDNTTATGAWWARHNMDSPTFQSEFDKFKADGYVLNVLSGYNTGTADRYAALWVKP
ncbi:hypothetical protein BDV12DRAFT_119241 [Aspergillus spectabilis]